MKKLKLSQYLTYTAIILGGIGLDQLTKWLAVKFLSIRTTLPLIDGVLHLTYVENRGAAFGMLANHRWLFILVSTIALLCMGFGLFAGFTDKKLYTVSISMMISGGIGNMIDRLALGYVVDFIDFRLINFAVFNGADSIVCIGAGLLMLALIRDLIKEEKAKRAGQGK